MRHILFVDDDTQYLRTYKRLVEKFLRKQHLPWQLYFSESADHALSTIRANRIDLIVSDISMPEKSGVDLLSEVKKKPRTKRIPVIMVSGKIDTDMKLTSLETGASDLLQKPFDETELLARISSCLRLKEYQDQILDQNARFEAEIKDRKKLARLTGSITTALVTETNLKILLQSCCQSIVDHLDTAFARVWVFDNEKQHLELAASAGMYTHINGGHQFVPIGKFKIGLIAQEKKAHLTNSVAKDPRISDRAWAKREKMVAFAGHPLIVKGQLAGVLAMFSRKKIKPSALEAISSVAQGIALGIVQKKSDDKAHFYSFYDTLTLLPNRKFFYVFLGRMIHYANRYLKRFALLLIDIDHFSRVNESLGHTAGDRCLKILSQRLLTILRNSDCLTRLSDEELPIARMGGDEFAVLVQNTSDVHHLSQLLKRLLKKLSESMNIGGRELSLSVSIGISVYPNDADSIIELFKNAQTALYHAKKKEKGHFVFYSHSMNTLSLEILDTEVNLRKALDNNELQLYYQPKVDTCSGKIVGAEALIRWISQDGKFISPGQFIPLAEENGLILPIGDWVVQTACRQNMEWLDIEPVPLAVNVSGRQFAQKDFVQHIFQFIDASGLDYKYIELEITETSLMMNPEKAIESLNAFKEKGIKISMDDFGTGYSSLSYLQKLPIDTLKIDLSFIRNILTNPRDAIMVKTIISMAHNMGLTIVAEGVENIEQLEYLKALKCDVVQGYFFSRPVPADEFKEFLKQQCFQTMPDS